MCVLTPWPRAETKRKRGYGKSRSSVCHCRTPLSPASLTSLPSLPCPPRGATFTPARQAPAGGPPPLTAALPALRRPLVTAASPLCDDPWGRSPLLCDGPEHGSIRQGAERVGSAPRAQSAGASLTPPRGLKAATAARWEPGSPVPFLVLLALGFPTSSPLPSSLFFCPSRSPAEFAGCLLLLVAPSSAVPVPQCAAQHAGGRGILQRNAAAVTLWRCLWAASRCHHRLQCLRAPRGAPGQAAPCSGPRRLGLAEAVALVAEEGRH